MSAARRLDPIPPPLTAAEDEFLDALVELYLDIWDAEQKPGTSADETQSVASKASKLSHPRS